MPKPERIEALRTALAERARIARQIPALDAPPDRGIGPRPARPSHRPPWQTALAHLLAAPAPLSGRAVRSACYCAPPRGCGGETPTNAGWAGGKYR